MRYLGRRWYIYAFAAVMAFAAGASMEWQCEGYTAAAISAIGEMSGAGLLKLSGYGLLSAAMILTTAAAPVETVSVYAAEEFQADETEVAGTENGDTATETTAEIAVDSAENETAGADESEETVAAASDAEGASSVGFCCLICSCN